MALTFLALLVLYFIGIGVFARMEFYQVPWIRSTYRLLGTVLWFGFLISVGIAVFK